MKKLLLALLLATSLSAQPRGLKVYISADMEGMGEQLGPTGFEYAKAREWMTGRSRWSVVGGR